MLSGVTNTKYAFRQHLCEIGFLMDQPREVVGQEFARHLGPQRFAQYQQIVANQAGEQAQDRVYDFMQDLREANLLRCMSPDVTLETSYYLYEKAVPLLLSGKRVIELACWTGGLASFIAQNHPECTLVGVDRVRRILDLNRAHYKLPNLRFEQWDYHRDEKPSDLQRTDVLLCGLGTNNDSGFGIYSADDSLKVRASKGYQREKQEALGYFRHWRQAANDEAILLAVLRVCTFPRFLAFMDAAQEAGWTALLEHFTFVQCSNNKEAIPSFVFAARRSAAMSEDMVLSHWTRISHRNEQLAQIVGPSALALYRALVRETGPGAAGVSRRTRARDQGRAGDLRFLRLYLRPRSATESPHRAHLDNAGRKPARIVRSGGRWPSHRPGGQQRHGGFVGHCHC